MLSHCLVRASLAERCLPGLTASKRRGSKQRAAAPALRGGAAGATRTLSSARGRSSLCAPQCRTSSSAWFTSRWMHSLLLRIGDILGTLTSAGETECVSSHWMLSHISIQ